jgi:uncharacterized protein YbaP (TraB family)
MNAMKKITLPLAMVLFACTWASAESSVWKVKKDNAVMYLGGTCHVLRQSDFPLPAEFDKAYKATERLVFETDLDKVQDPAMQHLMMTKAMYTDGTTLDKYLSPEVYNLLGKYCASNSIPIDGLKQFKASIVIVSITAMELMKLGISQGGVDLFFHKLATQDKKAVEKLETVEEQISFVTEMGKGEEDAFVRYSLTEIKNIKTDYEALVTAWKKGDEKKLDEMMIKDLKTKTPKIYKQLITDRNDNWLPRIEAFGKTPEKEFILVGVGHLVGPDGLIATLKKKGYTVEKL